jgi:hypothetical protein
MSRLSFPPSTTSKTLLTLGGETLSLRDWAKKSGVPYATLRVRYERGVRDLTLLNKTHLSVGHHRGVKHETVYEGQTISLRALAKKLNLNYEKLRARHIRGLQGEALVSDKKVVQLLDSYVKL